MLSKTVQTVEDFAADYGPLKERSAAYTNQSLAQKFLNGITKDCDATDYAAARGKIAGVHAQYDKFDRYCAELSILTTFGTAFAKAGNTTTAQAIEKAKKEAEGLIDPSLDVTAARKRIQYEMAKDDISALLVDYQIYVPVRKRIVTLHDQVLRFMEVKGPKDKVALEYGKCTKLAEVDMEYFAATEELLQLEILLKEVKTYATSHIQAKSLIASVKSVVKNDTKLKPTILTDTQATALDKRFSDADADADAEKLKLSTAEASYKSISSDLRSTAKKCSTVLENIDKKVNPRAGHSIDRHGPEIDSEDLIKRLTTGIAPDGIRSATNTSSAFENAEDWLATRERALEMAMDGTDGLKQPVGSPAGLPMNTKQFEYGRVIDHGRPIDKAFIGMKPAMKATSDGGIGSDGCYETFRETDGITKTWTLFLFEFLPPDSNGEVKDKKDYIKRYKAANSDADPTTLQWSWIVMQHFPYCEGWDPDTKTYTS